MPLLWIATLDRGIAQRPSYGQLRAGKVFYRDVAPGTYEVEVRSDELYPNQFKTVSLAPGSIAFVKIQEQPLWGQSDPDQGATFVVTIVDPAIGTAEISRLRLVPG